MIKLDNTSWYYSSNIITRLLEKIFFRKRKKFFTLFLLFIENNQKVSIEKDQDIYIIPEYYKVKH